MKDSVQSLTLHKVNGMPRYPGLNFYAAGRTDIRGVTTYTSGGPPPKKKNQGGSANCAPLPHRQTKYKKSKCTVDKCMCGTT